MEANRKRLIKSGYEYDRLFPRAQGGVYTVRKNASLDDTVAFIPKVVYENMGQTRAIAGKLKSDSVYDTCSNIWHFVYDHIQYRKDQNGYEQIRSPARAWHDRRQGVDCDCYSVFISSILLNLGIPHILRITKYREDQFQHIYPVVPRAAGEIIIDCVTNDFDYEVPYSEKKDFTMDLQFLNGFDDPAPSLGDTNLSPIGFAGGSVGELGKFRFKSLLNKLNKLNPGTILLRNGLLASMKLNLGGVAKKLRWSYLTPAQAAAKGVNADRFGKLVSVHKFLETVFYGAGGNLKNLKKAILKGKGNKDKAVMAGLGALDFGDIDYMNANTPLEELLGPDIYYSENERTFQGFKGFGALGEPVTLASIAAASGVIAKLVTALKKVGDIFGGKGHGSNTKVQTTDDSSAGSNNTDSPEGAASASPASFKRGVPTSSSAGADTDASTPGSTVSPVKATETDSTTAAESDTLSPGPVTTPVIPAAGSSGAHVASNSGLANKQGFWNKNKSWLKPVAIGAGGITLLAIGYHLLKATPHAPSPPLSGLRHPKNHSRKKKKKYPKTKTPVALL
ncbi:MAG TPA: hypothetical protein VF939_08970 [Puia sp.]